MTCVLHAARAGTARVSRRRQCCTVPAEPPCRCSRAAAAEAPPPSPTPQVPACRPPRATLTIAVGSCIRQVPGAGPVHGGGRGGRGCRAGQARVKAARMLAQEQPGTHQSSRAPCSSASSTGPLRTLRGGLCRRGGEESGAGCNQLGSRHAAAALLAAAVCRSEAGMRNPLLTRSLAGILRRSTLQGAGRTERVEWGDACVHKRVQPPASQVQPANQLSPVHSRRTRGQRGAARRRVAVPAPPPLRSPPQRSHPAVGLRGHISAGGCCEQLQPPVPQAPLPAEGDRLGLRPRSPTRGLAGRASLGRKWRHTSLRGR